MQILSERSIICASGVFVVECVLFSETQESRRGVLAKGVFTESSGLRPKSLKNQGYRHSSAVDTQPQPEEVLIIFCTFTLDLNPPSLGS